jgi:hypothetical protein
LVGTALHFLIGKYTSLQASGASAAALAFSWKAASSRSSVPASGKTGDGSPLQAVETFNGWISQQGPCYLSTNMHQAYSTVSLAAP